MPLYRTRQTFEVARNIKCFLNLDIGVIRGQVPQEDAQTKQQVNRLQRQLKSTREELVKARDELSRREKRQAKPGNSRSKQDGVVYDGILLPPPNLRPTRRGKMGEEVYFEATRQETEWMIENLGLSRTSSLLDLGCGSGRMALGILDRVGEIRKYRGLDVDKRFLGWARRNITPEHPNFQFIHVNMENAYYNPKGAKMNQDLVLPFGKDEFEIICLFSVFTHMLTDDVRAYLKEFYRVLKPRGKVLLTANLEDGVPEVSNNPIDYRGKEEYKRPLATVRYNREFFENLLAENGFHLERYAPELRRTQRCLILSKEHS